MKLKLYFYGIFIIFINFFYRNHVISNAWGYALKSTEVAEILESVGFPPGIVPSMTCISKHESSFRPHIENFNKNGTIDYGLMQVNTIWLARCNATEQSIMDVYTNAKCAYLVYQIQGVTAWVTFNKFRSECLSYKIPNYSSVEAAESYVTIVKNDIVL